MKIAAKSVIFIWYAMLVNHTLSNAFAPGVIIFYFPRYVLLSLLNLVKVVLWRLATFKTLSFYLSDNLFFFLQIFFLFSKEYKIHILIFFFFSDILFFLSDIGFIFLQIFFSLLDIRLSFLQIFFPFLSDNLLSFCRYSFIFFFFAF